MFYCILYSLAQLDLLGGDSGKMAVREAITDELRMSLPDIMLHICPIFDEYDVKKLKEQIRVIFPSVDAL